MAVKKQAASDDLLLRLHGLSGCITRGNEAYGSVPEMLQHEEWDSALTKYTTNLLAAIASDVKQLETEKGSDRSLKTWTLCMRTISENRESIPLRTMSRLHSYRKRASSPIGHPQPFWQ